MARTIVGMLQILVKQAGANETKTQITNALNGIERATARLSNSAWGAKFDQQLDRLKVSPTERAAILASYDRLQAALNGKMTAGAKSNWRGGVLSYLSTMRQEMGTTEKRATTMVQRLAATFSSVGRYALGGAVVYGGYAAARGGVNAAAEQQRVEAVGHFAGLSEGEQGALKAAAEEMSAKYNLSMANVLQALQEAALAMPDTASAIASADDIARLLTSLETLYGPDGAVTGAYDILKALDNVGMNQSPEEINKALDAFMRAQQVLGADFSPAAFKQMLQYSRLAGKSLDDDFLLTWMPLLASETAGADAGTKIRASFDQLIVGRASKKAENAQKKYGIRDGETGLKGQELYAQNPILWANEILLPALKSHGVDTENNVELGKAIGEITGNRQSADFLASALISFTQYVRTATERIPNASGLAAADEVRQRDPFAATQGMINSLGNLAGSLGEHVFPTIVPGLNAISSTVEKLATIVRGSSDAQLGLAGLAALLGGIGAWKVGSAAIGGITALTTAGPSLQTAAVMLQSAATSLNGGAAADAVSGGKSNPVGGWAAGLLAWLKGAVVVGAPAAAADLAIGGPNTVAEYDAQVAEQGRIKAQLWDMINGLTGWGAEPTRTLDSPFNFAGPIMPGSAEAADLSNIDAKATATGQSLNSLNGTVSPQVDTKSLETALDLANRLKAALQGIGDLAANRSSSVQSDVNASLSDFGIVP